MPRTSFSQRYVGLGVMKGNYCSILEKLSHTEQPLPAVNCNGMVAGLLLLLLHRRDDVDHAFSVGGDSHLWPAVEMKLTHRSSLVLLEI